MGLWPTMASGAVPVKTPVYTVFRPFFATQIPRTPLTSANGFSNTGDSPLHLHDTSPDYRAVKSRIIATGDAGLMEQVGMRGRRTGRKSRRRAPGEIRAFAGVAPGCTASSAGARAVSGLRPEAISSCQELADGGARRR